MKTVKISLNSIDKVKSFVNDITKFDYDFDLVSGRYVIDAKSIMGIFSLDLSKPIDLNIHADDNVDESGMDKEQTLVKENIDELIDRCGKMRLLDEKHAEAEFIEGKMKIGAAGSGFLNITAVIV